MASLQNAAGKYVAPTNAGMTAALGDMTTAKNHITQQIKFKNAHKFVARHKSVRDAYPLTMVIYAMVPDWRHLEEEGGEDRAVA